MCGVDRLVPIRDSRVWHCCVGIYHFGEIERADSSVLPSLHVGPERGAFGLAQTRHSSHSSDALESDSGSDAHWEFVCLSSLLDGVSFPIWCHVQYGVPGVV